MLTEHPKFYGYIRVSSRGQVSGDGPERQAQAISDFARVNGLTLLDSFREDGVSGTVEGMDRPAFTSLVELVERERAAGVWVTGIIVERMDRLARDLMVSEMMLKECRERRIAVFCADQGLENVADSDSDPTRKLIRQVLGALAEWEKSALVMKLRKARERQKAKDGRCEGQKPMGKNQMELKVVNFIRLAMTSGYSHARAAEEMNTAGLRNRKGGLWTAVSVEYLYRKFGKQNA